MAASLFPNDPFISISDQIRELEREIGERQRVYRQMVTTGRLSQSFADHRLDLMEAILQILEDVRDRKLVPAQPSAAEKLLEHDQLAMLAAAARKVVRADMIVISTGGTYSGSAKRHVEPAIRQLQLTLRKTGLEE